MNAEFWWADVDGKVVCPLFGEFGSGGEQFGREGKAELNGRTAFCKDFAASWRVKEIALSQGQ